MRCDHLLDKQTKRSPSYSSVLVEEAGNSPHHAGNSSQQAENSPHHAGNSSQQVENSPHRAGTGTSIHPEPLLHNIKKSPDHTCLPVEESTAQQGLHVLGHVIKCSPSSSPEFSIVQPTETGSRYIHSSAQLGDTGANEHKATQPAEINKGAQLIKAPSSSDGQINTWLGDTGTRLSSPLDHNGAHPVDPVNIGSNERMTAKQTVGVQPGGARTLEHSTCTAHPTDTHDIRDIHGSAQTANTDNCDEHRGVQLGDTGTSMLSSLEHSSNSSSCIQPRESCLNNSEPRVESGTAILPSPAHNANTVPTGANLTQTTSTATSSSAGIPFPQTSHMSSHSVPQFPGFQARRNQTVAASFKASALRPLNLQHGTTPSAPGYTSRVPGSILCSTLRVPGSALSSTPNMPGSALSSTARAPGSALSSTPKQTFGSYHLPGTLRHKTPGEEIQELLLSSDDDDKSKEQIHSTHVTPGLPVFSSHVTPITEGHVAKGDGDHFGHTILRKILDPRVQSGGSLLQECLVAKAPGSSMQQQTSSIQQPGSSIQQPARIIQLPGNRMQQPTSSVQQPANRMQQQTSNMQQPARSMQQQTSSMQQPGNKMQQQTSSIQQPGNKMQQQASSVQQRTNSVQQPANSMQQQGAVDNLRNTLSSMERLTDKFHRLHALSHITTGTAAPHALNQVSNSDPSSISRIPRIVLPVSGIPSSHAPGSGIPSSHVPVSGIPTSDAPVLGIPSSDAPVMGIPSSDAPVSGIPSSDAPVSGIPSSDAPVSGIPSSHASVSGIPSSAASDSSHTVPPTTHQSQCLNAPTTRTDEPKKLQPSHHAVKDKPLRQRTVTFSVADTSSALTRPATSGVGKVPKSPRSFRHRTIRPSPPRPELYPVPSLPKAAPFSPIRTILSGMLSGQGQSQGQIPPSSLGQNQGQAVSKGHSQGEHRYHGDHSKKPVPLHWAGGSVKVGKSVMESLPLGSQMGRFGTYPAMPPPWTLPTMYRKTSRVLPPLPTVSPYLTPPYSPMSPANRRSPTPNRELPQHSPSQKGRRSWRDHSPVSSAPQTPQTPYSDISSHGSAPATQQPASPAGNPSPHTAIEIMPEEYRSESGNPDISPGAHGSVVGEPPRLHQAQVSGVLSSQTAEAQDDRDGMSMLPLYAPVITSQAGPGFPSESVHYSQGNPSEGIPQATAISSFQTDHPDSQDTLIGIHGESHGPSYQTQSLFDDQPDYHDDQPSYNVDTRLHDNKTPMEALDLRSNARPPYSNP